MEEEIQQSIHAALSSGSAVRKLRNTALAYLSLGSNWGGRKAKLREAIELLARHPALELENYSAVYQTKPYGPVHQEAFWNLCLKLRVDEPLLLANSLAAHYGSGQKSNMVDAANALLQFCLQCEAQIGRDRSGQGQHWGPRSIDIDLIDYDFLDWSSPALRLPHPYFCDRLFVLVPLAEIADQNFLQVYGVRQKIADLLSVPANLDWGYPVIADLLTNSF